MYAFSDRQKKIIRYLMQMPAFVKGKVLADALHISLRTLQYEITAINQIFHDKLILSTNQGYMTLPSAAISAQAHCYLI